MPHIKKFFEVAKRSGNARRVINQLSRVKAIPAFRTAIYPPQKINNPATGKPNGTYTLAPTSMGSRLIGAKAAKPASAVTDCSVVARKPSKSNNTHRAMTFMFKGMAATALSTAMAYTTSASLESETSHSKLEKTKLDTLTNIKQLMSKIMPNDDVGISASFIPDKGDAEALFSFNDSQKFSMASIYKIPMIIHALRLAEMGKLNLETVYEITKEDLRSEWPLRDPNTLFKPGQKVLIKDLLQDMVEYSGGTATDIILKLVGGTQAVSNFIQGQAQIKDIQLDRNIYEACRDMGLNTSNPALVNLEAVDDGFSDKATAKAIDLLLQKTLKGEIINADNVIRLRCMLNKSRTLEPKVLSRLDKPTKVGNKTGTVPGVLNHCVLVMDYTNGDVSGTLAITIFTKHKINKQTEDNKNNKLTKEDRKKIMDNGCELMSVVIPSVIKIAEIQLTHNTQQKKRQLNK